MAFKKKNFGCIDGGSVDMPRTWRYYNEDGDTITAVNFPANVGIKTGDLLLVLSKNTTAAPVYYKLTVSGDVATASAFAS